MYDVFSNNKLIDKKQKNNNRLIPQSDRIISNKIIKNIRIHKR